MSHHGRASVRCGATGVGPGPAWFDTIWHRRRGGRLWVVLMEGLGPGAASAAPKEDR